MIKVEEISKYVSDDILSNIFEEREEEIYSSKNGNESPELKKVKSEYTITYEKLVEVIKNLPPHFKNCRESILEALDQYSERENLIQSFDNEKFYKVGFCDGVKMMVDIIKDM